MMAHAVRVHFYRTMRMPPLNAVMTPTTKAVGSPLPRERAAPVPVCEGPEPDPEREPLPLPLDPEPVGLDTELVVLAPPSNCSEEKV